jgi:hypothetical protein
MRRVNGAGRFHPPPISTPIAAWRWTALRGQAETRTIFGNEVTIRTGPSRNMRRGILGSELLPRGDAIARLASSTKYGHYWLRHRFRSGASDKPTSASDPMLSGVQSVKF